MKLFKTTNPKAIFLALIATLLPVFPLFGNEPPPFGASLQWETQSEAPSLQAMSGKSVLVIFFQDWCPLCNKWSGRLFSQLTETYGDDPEVVLVALKVDGGSTSDAVKYLKSRTDIEKWLIAADEGGSYYRQALNMKALYRYMWITPTGQIGESGKCGEYAPGNKQFTLTTTSQQEKFREIPTPFSQKVPPFRTNSNPPSMLWKEDST